eukprot:scaffold166320_cov36-Prasinocladus_malaysianus.AAC.2
MYVMVCTTQQYSAWFSFIAFEASDRPESMVRRCTALALLDATTNTIKQTFIEIAHYPGPAQVGFLVAAKRSQCQTLPLLGHEIILWVNVN